MRSEWEVTSEHSIDLYFWQDSRTWHIKERNKRRKPKEVYRLHKGHFWKVEYIKVILPFLFLNGMKETSKIYIERG